ncbi:MAG: DNA polymerase IV [Clostridia bacterium]|nr:DNA polymerase IV [Clostridia bacterium]
MFGVKKMERVILHADANSFYASVECYYHPEYKDRPLAVCGDPEARHGIVLAKNQAAKRFHIQTGEAVWQARQKCPELVVMPPHFDAYQQFSGALQSLYGEYTHRVEALGLDECWLDVSGMSCSVREGQHIADEIRMRAIREIGITLSVGVSFNKTFAKLGSDLKKPNGTTVITRRDMPYTVWPLPASDMLMVGPHTMQKLRAMGVLTIGDLACCDPRVLQRRMGKCGLLLQELAAGRDITPVTETAAADEIKSIGNSTTPPFDIVHLDDARQVFYVLAESVSARLRAAGFRAKCISVSARTTELVTASHQCTLSRSTDMTHEIMDAVMRLFAERFGGHFPYRSVGISTSQLMDSRTPEQVSLFFNEEQRAKRLRLEETIDTLRGHYGKGIVVRGSLMDEKGVQLRGAEQQEEENRHEIPGDNKFKGVTSILVHNGARLPSGKGKR